MRSTLLILLALNFQFALFSQNPKSEFIKKLSTIESWQVSITHGITEGPDHKYFNFTPEIKAVFTRKSKTSCLSPRLEFYPIALKDTIHNRLIKRMRLRSDLFPPSPEIFYSTEYLVFAWELESYDNKICCNCEQLRYALIRGLNLTGGLNRLINRIFDADELDYSDGELRSIMEQMLNLPDLGEYFHVEEDPDRLPLVLEQTSIVQAARLEGLKKFGQDVLILDRNEIDKGKFKSYLLIDKWFMENGLLNIQLHYPIEGMFTTASFEKVIDG